MRRFAVYLLALLCACSQPAETDLILPSDLRRGETLVAMFQSCDIQSCKRGLARIEGDTITVAGRSHIMTNYQGRILDAWLISGCLGEDKGDEGCSGAVVMRTAVVRGDRLTRTTEPKFYSHGTDDFPIRNIIVELIRDNPEAEVWSELNPTMSFEAWLSAEKN